MTHGAVDARILMMHLMREIHEPTVTITRLPLYAREALLPTTVQFCMYLTFTSYTTFLPLYARSLGMGNAGFLYSTYALALISTRVFGANISDMSRQDAFFLVKDPNHPAETGAWGRRIGLITLSGTSGFSTPSSEPPIASHTRAPRPIW
jgi:MFS family permease